jgi:hypothetical protein
MFRLRIVNALTEQTAMDVAESRHPIFIAVFKKRWLRASAERCNPNWQSVNHVM